MPDHPPESPGTSQTGHIRQGSGNRSDETFRVGWKMGAIGFEVASEAVAGLLLGLAIDAIFGTGRRWTLIGAIAGICVGLWSLIRGSLKLNRELEANTPSRGHAKAISDEAWVSWENEDDAEGDGDERDGIEDGQKRNDSGKQT